MPLPRAPRSLDPDDYQRVSRPVAAMAKDFADGHVIAPHGHRRAQLIYASGGTMGIATAGGIWTVPPQRALWMPAGIVHEIRMWGAVSMRTLYVEPATATGLPTTVRVIAVAPLLRELIVRACQMPILYEEAGADGHVMALILHEIGATPALDLGLVVPADVRLARVCVGLRQHPGDNRALEAWASEVGATARTLARLFRKHTGLSFAGWRQQARLQAAVARLAAGEPVTTVAFDLGYDSVSAFGAMFRRAMGVSPSRYFSQAHVETGVVDPAVS